MVFYEDAPNDMLIDLDTERFGDDQRDPWTAEARIATFDLYNGANEWLG